jgi:hypothetical protein
MRIRVTLVRIWNRSLMLIPVEGSYFNTLMRIWIQILLLGVADLVGCKPFSGLRIRIPLVLIWIRSLMLIHVAGSYFSL